MSTHRILSRSFSYCEACIFTKSDFGEVCLWVWQAIVVEIVPDRKVHSFEKDIDQSTLVRDDCVFSRPGHEIVSILLCVQASEFQALYQYCNIFRNRLA